MTDDRPQCASRHHTGFRCVKRQHTKGNHVAWFDGDVAVWWPRADEGTGNSCNVCGGLMIRTGTCETCTSCGESGGCA